MSPRQEFHPLQAQEIASAFQKEGVEYLLRDIISSKTASGRQKDLIDLPLLESFRAEYEKRHAPLLRSAPTSPARRPTQAEKTHCLFSPFSALESKGDGGPVFVLLHRQRSRG